jgi:transcriptional regulator with XRE-family HTH domain
MNSPNLNSKLPATELGVLLRHWRDTRGRSQIDLSLDAGVSQRHISFIESGRSVPSRQMLMDLAQALDVPLRERNTLLLAAGYAPLYAESAWNAQEMQSVTRAMERILRQHEPFPALVMDRYWNVLMTNDAAPRFFNCFIDMAARTGPRNMLHLVFDPQGMRPFVANWEAVAPDSAGVPRIRWPRDRRENARTPKRAARLPRCAIRVDEPQGTGRRDGHAAAACHPAQLY